MVIQLNYRAKMWRISVIVLFGLLFLSACSSAGVGDTAPEIVPTPQLDPNNLSLEVPFQIRDDRGGVITLNYPIGWYANTQPDNLQLATSEQIASGELGIIPSGEIGIQMITFPPNEALAFVSGASVSAMSILNVFMDITANDLIESFGLPESITSGQYEIARVYGQSDNGDAMLTVINLEQAYLVMIAATAPNEINRFADLLDAISQSVTYRR